MSKIRKGPSMTTRLRVQRQDMTLPKLFDMIALIAFLGAVILAGGTYILNEKLDALDKLHAYGSRYDFWMMWIRATFTLMMYCLVTFASAYGMGRFMRDQEHDQVKYFRQWFAAELILAVLLVFNIAVPF